MDEKMNIAPSVLTADFTTIQNTITKLEKLEIDSIHIDIMDGHFVPNITFGSKMVKDIRPYTKKELDVHLMVQDPLPFIDEFVSAGADLITVHVESTSHIHKTIQIIKEYNSKAGVALNPGTPVSLVEPLLEEVDLVLQMSVNPGYGGQSFLSSTLRNVQALKEMREKLNLSYDIQMDGGINVHTIQNCKASGADRIVAGSALIDQPNWEEALVELKEKAD